MVTLDTGHWKCCNIVFLTISFKFILYELKRYLTKKKKPSGAGGTRSATVTPHCEIQNGHEGPKNGQLGLA